MEFDYKRWLESCGLPFAKKVSSELYLYELFREISERLFDSPSFLSLSLSLRITQNLSLLFESEAPVLSSGGVGISKNIAIRAEKEKFCLESLRLLKEISKEFSGEVLEGTKEKKGRVYRVSFGGNNE